MNSKLLFRFILMGLMLLALVLAGCDDGDDGRDGAQGVQGEQGIQGEPGPVTLTNESCAVCHGDGQILDINEIHPEPLEIPVVEVVSIDSVAGVGDSVTFNVFEADGETPITGLTFGDLRFYMADMLPAGETTTTTYTDTTTPTTVFPTAQLARWMYERERDGYKKGSLEENLDPVTDLPSGSYTYTFATDLAAGGSENIVPVAPVAPVFEDYDSQQDYDANYADDLAEYNADLAIFNDPTQNIVAAPDFDLTHTQRLLIRVDTRDMGFDRTTGLVDFVIPADGASTSGLAALSRDIIDRSACTACHGDPLEQASHGGGYQSMAACVICHTPIGNTYGDLMQDTGAWAANLFHKIHAAIPMEAFPDRIDGKGYDAVKYPENIRNCEKCHLDNGQSMAASWETPQNEACGSCHGVVHSGTVPNDICLICHDGSVAPSVTTAHEIVDPATYFTTIELSPDANDDGVYEAGETPMVTVTVADANGDPVSAYDGLNTTFNNANLYVYGPRTKPVPVLTTNSTTDPDNPGVDQGRTMFSIIPRLVPGPVTPGNITVDADGKPILDDPATWTTNDDPLVATDATGFKYQLQAIPDTLEPGTYFIQAYVTHIASTPPEYFYRNTVSEFGWAIAQFQVGTAPEQKAIAGDCTVCHEANVWGSMYHRGYFAEDGCIACHDLSANYANYLGNRVHAVHSETPQGDLNGPVDEWADVTFPRNTNSCEACHNSGNMQYREDPNMYAPNCYGCHGATEGVQDHMIQNGAAVFD